jgi:hypothetical protein
VREDISRAAARCTRRGDALPSDACRETNAFSDAGQSMSKPKIISQDQRPAPLNVGGFMTKGNAAAMFTEFDKGINWESPDRTELIAIAASHGQTIVP